MQEFETLSKIHPANLTQAQLIDNAIRRFKREHPELDPQIKRFYAEELENTLDRLGPHVLEALNKMEA